MYFGATYYPEHRDPSRWDYDLDNMEKANVNALRMGEFAWKRFEPEDGKYDFKWMDDFMEKASRKGISVVMCPPLRTVPAWLVEKEPSMLLETEEGIRLEFGSRYTFCINNPLLREKGIALAAAMAKHYGPNDMVVGWQIDNELGDESDCHCPVCREKWQNWLQERYGTVENMNRAWGTLYWSLSFDHFGQIPTPRVTKVTATRNAGYVQAWRHFRSECTIEIMRMIAEVMRPHVRGRPITTNNQTWNTRTDYYEMDKHLDVCGTNYYPLYGKNGREKAFALAAVRSYKDKNFMALEVRSDSLLVPGRFEKESTPEPGEVERLTMHMIANGADAIYYYRWNSLPFGTDTPWGALTDYDGKPKRVYYECKNVGGKLKKLSSLIEGTKVKSEVAILYDFPTRWMVESPTLMSNPENNIELYRDVRDKLFCSIRGLGINCDAVGRDGDFDRYKVIAVPMFSAVDDGVVDKLCRYVEKGGILLWHPLSGMNDHDATIYPGRLHPGLEKLLGVNLLDFAIAASDVKSRADADENAVLADSDTRLQKNEYYISWQGKRYPVGFFFDLPILTGARSIAEYASMWFAGNTAIAENRTGKGRTYFVTSFAEEGFYSDFLSFLCREAGVKPILNTAVPKLVEIAERKAPDGRRLIFLLSYSNKEEVLTLDRRMEDVWSEVTVEGKVTLKPFGVSILKDITT